MRLSLVLGVIGQLLRLFSVAFLAPLGMALYDGSWVEAGHFAVALGAAFLAGSLLAIFFKPSPVFRRSEALGDG